MIPALSLLALLAFASMLFATTVAVLVIDHRRAKKSERRVT